MINAGKHVMIKALSVSEKWENKELKFYITYVGLEKW
jgi:hypothetical protein